MSAKQTAKDDEESARQIQIGGSESLDEAVKIPESEKWTFAQACALNTLNMFGTGPFITCAILFQTVDPAGPQALYGYFASGVLVFFDSFVWGELSSIWPYTGGSYAYLSEMYGKDKWGSLIAFLYLWQLLISGPLEVAGGFVAAADYMRFFVPMSDLAAKFVAFGLSIFCFLAMYTGIRESARMTYALWIFTVAAVLYVYIAGFANFDASHFKSPSGWEKSLDWKTFGMLMRIGIFDFTGYYDACHIGDQIRNPTYVIPRATIITCGSVVVMCVGIYSAIYGVLNADDIANMPSNYIISEFSEKLFGHGVAILLTIVVTITILASCYSMIVGYVVVPYIAARDGFFLKWFHHHHPTKTGLPDHSLLVCAVVTSACCFIELETIIEALMTTRIIVQFCGQSFGLIYYRYTHPETPRPFRCPLYPLPSIVSFFGFGFVLVTTSSWIGGDSVALLEMSVIYLAIGCVCFHIWAKAKHHWPYQKLATGDEEKTKDEKRRNMDGHTATTSAA